MKFEQYGIGQPVRRREDVRFVTGQGCYLDDIETNAVRAVFVRSPYAHAKMRGIGIDAARAMPGVLAVLTGEDWIADGLNSIPTRTPAKNSSGDPIPVPDRPGLAVNRARFVGDAVVMVVAENLDVAMDAAERIEIDYEPLPAVVRARDAAAADAPTIWEHLPDNVCCTYSTGDADAVQQAMADAAHVVTLDIDNQRVTAAPIETRGAIGAFDGERFLLTCATQNVHQNRDDLAKALNVEPDRIRLTAPDIGGGFGAKNAVYPEYALVLWAAQRIGRPVKWVSDRSESFASDTHGRDQQSLASLALDADGKFLALKIDTIGPIGPYVMTIGPFVPTSGSARTQGGPYRIPALHYHSRAVFTNTVPTDPYRGAGRPEASYLIERLVDTAAAEMDLDPAELRRRNLIPPDALPYTSGTGLLVDCGDFPSVFEQTLVMARYDEFADRARDSEARGLLRGIGIGAYLECTGGGPKDNARIAFDAEGVTLSVGTHSTGMGHETVFTHLVATRLGLSPESIRFVQGDTDAVPIGSGHGGSRSIEVGGAAVTVALEAVIEKGRDRAGDMLEVSGADLEFVDGQYRVVGADIATPFSDVLAAAGADLNVLEDYTRESMAFPNGCHIAEVEVDPGTGAIKLFDFTAVDDFGRIINPLTAEGQVAGGIAQGIGQALYELVAFDTDGQLLSGSYMDYAMPRAEDMPFFRVAFDETTPASSNLLGVKGSGEAGCCGAPPAVVNAVINALRPLGVTHIDMPLTPLRVWEACRK